MDATIEQLKAYLKEEFGITSTDQLLKEYKKLKPIDIGMFTKPIKTNNQKVS